MLARAAESVGMAGVHPHLLRHATGFKLVNQGVDTRTLAAYLGHRQIANTARYTKMDARRNRALIALAARSAARRRTLAAPQKGCAQRVTLTLVRIICPSAG